MTLSAVLSTARIRAVPGGIQHRVGYSIVHIAVFGELHLLPSRVALCGLFHQRCSIPAEGNAINAPGRSTAFTGFFSLWNDRFPRRGCFSGSQMAACALSRKGTWESSRRSRIWDGQTCLGSERVNRRGLATAHLSLFTWTDGP